MWQLANWNGCNFGEVISAEHLNFIESSDRDIGKSAIVIVSNINMIGNWSSVDRFQDRERRIGIKYHYLSNVLQCEPDLLSVRRRSNIRTEWAHLVDPSYNLVISHIDHNCFWSKGRTDITVLPIR